MRSVSKARRIVIREDNWALNFYREFHDNNDVGGLEFLAELHTLFAFGAHTWKV